MVENQSMEGQSPISPVTILEASYRVTSRTIEATLLETGWSLGELGRQLKVYRQEGAFANQPYSRQAVYGYMIGHHPISQPFALAMARLVSGNGHVRAVNIITPDLEAHETIPHGASMRGYCRRCACGCGLIVMSSAHHYYDDEHLRLACNTRRRQRYAERKKENAEKRPTV